MNTTKKFSKDTILMTTLLAAALFMVGFASIHTSDELQARDAALMVVKSATLIADAGPVNATVVLS